MIKTFLIVFTAVVSAVTPFYNNHYGAEWEQPVDTIQLSKQAAYKAIKQQNKWALYKGSQQLTPFLYESIAAPSANGLIKVCKRYDSCGYINGEGKVVIPAEYYLGSFAAFNSKGMIPASKMGDNNQYFLHVDGKVEMFAMDMDAAIQSTMTPTPFPAALEVYRKMTDSLVFKSRNCFRCNGINRWTPETILHRSLRAFLQEPVSYDFNPQVIQAYALPGGGGNLLDRHYL